jgi:hypothetical protein
MTLVSPSQSNPNDEITAAAINTPVNQIAAILNGGIDSTNIASLTGAKIQAGTVSVAALDTNANVETRLSETHGNFFASGCVWSIISGFNGTMTSGVVYINGKRIAVSSVASKTFTASKDTYVSVDVNGTVSYSEVANGAAAPALPANSVWDGVIVTSASVITAVRQWGEGVSGVPIYPDNGLQGWRAWTPTWTNLSIGNATVDFKYAIVGKTVHIRGKFIYGSSTSISGNVAFTAPVNYNSGYNVRTVIGNLSIEDAGTASYFGYLRINDSVSTNLLQFGISNVGGTYATYAAMTATVPMTWAAGDQIMINATYEAA